MKRVPIILGLMVLASMAWGQLMFQPGHVAGLVATSTINPSDVAGLTLWLKPDAGVTLNGTNVSAVADQSGNGNNFSQGNAAYQPGLVSNAQNSLPAFDFRGGQTFSWQQDAEGCFGGVSNATVFIAAKPRTTPSGSGYWFISAYSVGYAFKGIACQERNGGTTNAIWSSMNGDANAYSHGSGFPTNENRIFTWSADQGVITAYTNGVQIGVARTETMALQAATKYCIGGQSSYGHSGYVYEMLVYTNTLSATDRNNVVNYLKTRWGL